MLLGAVTVFDNFNCSGNNVRFYWNPNDPDGGQYTYNDIREAGLRNDSVSSILVPPGYTAKLYKHDGFYPEPYVVKGAYADSIT